MVDAAWPASGDPVTSNSTVSSNRPTAGSNVGNSPYISSNCQKTPTSGSTSMQRGYLQHMPLQRTPVGGAPLKTPTTNGSNYSNSFQWMIDLQDSNKFLPLSKLSPTMNERIQRMPILKQQGIYDNRQKVRDLFFKLLRQYSSGLSCGNGISQTRLSKAEGSRRVAGAPVSSWETTMRMAFLELRRECKEENIEYCLELFFRQLAENARSKYFPEASSSFAEALGEELSAKPKANDDVDFPCLGGGGLSTVTRLDKENQRNGGHQRPQLNLKYDKLNKLEKRFTEKPASPCKRSPKATGIAATAPTGATVHPLSPLICANYTSFLAGMAKVLQKYPAEDIRFLVEFLLVVDSYQFIRNCFWILGEKLVSLSNDLKDQVSNLASDGPDRLGHFRDLYLEMWICGKMYGFLMALETFNLGKYGKKGHAIAEEGLLRERLASPIHWIDWALLDALLTYQTLVRSDAVPWVEMRNHWSIALKNCDVSSLRISLGEKLNVTLDCCPTKETEEMASLRTLIAKLHVKDYQEPCMKNDTGSSDRMTTDVREPRRVIKPISLLFVPETDEMKIQKTLRQWFLKRHPRVQALLESTCKTLPDFLMEELLLRRGDRRDDPITNDRPGDCSLNPDDFMANYTKAMNLARGKVRDLLAIYLPEYLKCSHDSQSEASSVVARQLGSGPPPAVPCGTVLEAAATILLEMLRPELYRKCSLFVQR